MKTSNAEINYRRRRADEYLASQSRSQNHSQNRGGPVRYGDRYGSRPEAGPASRPAWRPYEPPRYREREAYRSTRPVRNEADYHPQTPLKTMTPAELRAIFLVVAVVMAVSMVIIMLAAEAAMTQKEINDLRNGIAQVDDDIANLKIEIEQSKNMQIIKNRAADELGLKEPSFDQYVYVRELPEPQTDFGRYIKERAYGGARSQEQEQEPEPEQEEE